MADKKSSELNEQAVQRVMKGLTTFEEEKKLTKDEVEHLAKAQSEYVKSKGLTVGIDIDVSQAMKGLKALQRQTKETVRALKELEKVSERIRRVSASDLNSVTINVTNATSSEEIVEEMATSLTKILTRNV